MSTFRCRYCRQVHDGSGPACPPCGASIDITARVTDSGWMEQPMIGDMTRLRCGDTRCQIAGTVVPVAEFGLGRNDWIYFSHHVLLWADAVTTMRAMAADDRPDRRIAGFQVILLAAHGPGHTGVPDNDAGELTAIPRQHGREVLAHQSRFLCATGSVAHRRHRSQVYCKKWKGGEQEREYPIGPFCDSFTARDQPGLLLLRSPGTPSSAISVPTRASCTAVFPGVLGRHRRAHPAPGTPAQSRRAEHEGPALLPRRLAPAPGPGRGAVQSVYELAESTGKLDVFSFGSTRRW